MKLLLVNTSNYYRLDSSYALNCRGPITLLWTTKPLCTQIQSLLLLYDPKLDFTVQIFHYGSIP